MGVSKIFFIAVLLLALVLNVQSGWADKLKKVTDKIVKFVEKVPEKTEQIIQKVDTETLSEKVWVLRCLFLCTL